MSVCEHLCVLCVCLMCVSVVVHVCVGECEHVYMNMYVRCM